MMNLKSWYPKRQYWLCDSYPFKGRYLMTPSVSRLYIIDGRIINEYGAVGGMWTGRGNLCTRRNTATLSTLNPAWPVPDMTPLCVMCTPRNFVSCPISVYRTAWLIPWERNRKFQLIPKNNLNQCNLAQKGPSIELRTYLFPHLKYIFSP
jgi:hypothetical protein